jgi:UDP-N-acetylglucosamine acyltransferase
MNFRWFERSTVNERPGVHPTATIGSDVQLEEGATIGAYCVVEGRVKIGAGTTILPHTIIRGTTLIGDGCRIGPHAAVGTDPQHHTYDGRETYLVIEDNVIIREFATVHRATQTGLEHATRVGRGSLLMVGSHVAHDCRVGEHVTLVNAVQLGGHVTVGDRAIVGGGTVIHQFVRIGRLAIIAGGEALSKDVLPFGAVFHGRHKGYNAIGCRRAGLDTKAIHRLRAAFRAIHSHRSARQAALELKTTYSSDSDVHELIDFIETSSRGIQPSSSAMNGEAEITS